MIDVLLAMALALPMVIYAIIVEETGQNHMEIIFGRIMDIYILEIEVN